MQRGLIYDRQNMNILTPTTKRPGGFTLVETLVAITLLMLVMVAFMSLARVGLTMSLFSKDRVVAYYLAQDAMQYIVNVHYNDVRNNSSDFNRILSQCDVSIGCLIDTVNEDPVAGTHITNCLTTPCPPIRYDPSAKSYNYNPSFPTSLYRRSIFVEQSGYETHARVVVAWEEESGTTRSIELERYFYDLQSFIP